MKMENAQDGTGRASSAEFENFREKLVQLVARFDKNLVHYKSGGYDEASVRQEFLNPLFRALGWDIENEAGLIPQHCEVEIESRTAIAGRQKFADYLFRTDRKDRFICEAKKPAEALHGRYAFQAKRYAWNKGLVLAILSDFEEMKIYIVGSRPLPDDADLGCFVTWHYSTYPEVAQKMWDLLSRVAVAADSIERLVDSLPRKPVAKGRAKQQWLIKPDRNRALDVDFLNFLDQARHNLASDLINNNDRAFLLAGSRLDEAVQRILDRLLFLRICEDRDIDTGRTLANIFKHWSVTKDTSLWRLVVAHFRALDRRPPSHIPFFNGNLFKPHFSEELQVSDQWTADFIDEIGDDESPYLFNVIPVEILGTIYERFLGKTIRPKGRGVTIEEKPEVRKAGGVYYTPRYIVDYIVEQTVGKLLESKTPKESLSLRVLDPACGSGSFLIRAFERICEHWQTALIQNVKLRRKTDCWVNPQTGDVHLTTDLKRRILTANIYGVDLDPGAVEVTQLSLYLKMLEGENRTTLARERDLFGSDVPLLPPLQENIKCGNSLIGPDFSLDPDDITRIRTFDWKVGFRDIVKMGGFDAVVGNPPYILLQTMEERAVFDYIRGNYRTARYKIDTYQVFMEQALRQTRDGGYFGFITPNSFLRNKHAIELRSLILETTEVSALRTFYYPVFKGASVDTCILIARKVAGPNNNTEIDVVRSELPDQLLHQTIRQQKWRAHPQRHFFLPSSEATDDLLDKIRNGSFPLGDIATAYFGIQTFSRVKYVTNNKTLKTHKPVIDGTHIQRYDLLTGNEFVDFRPRSIKSGGQSLVYEAERIGVRQIGKTPIATIVPGGIYSLNTIYNIFFTKRTDLSLRFVLGLLSSSTGRWYWVQSFFDQKETFPKVKKDALLSLPIPKLNLSIKADHTRHDKLVSLVEKMLVLAPKLRAARSETDRATLQNAITSTDRQIDTLVYELYSLTPEEIALIQESGN